MTEYGQILLAEDDDTDVLLLERALKEVEVPNPMHVVNDGQEAIDHLSELQQAPGPGDRMPALIILDLKMPRLTGFDVLQWMRADPGLRCVPTIVLSTSAQPHDVERAFAMGANAFVVKSPATSERLEFARLIRAWLHFNQLPLACTEGYRAAHALHTSSQFFVAAQR